jgi:hypothetical protein
MWADDRGLGQYEIASIYLRRARLNEHRYFRCAPEWRWSTSPRV